MVSGSIPSTPASSTTKTGRHDIAESGVKTPKINQCTYQPVLYGSVWVELFNTSCLLVYEQAVVQSRRVHPSSPFPFCKFHCRECCLII
jgi:hypothetical protein